MRGGGIVYKHRSCLDVKFLVHKIQYAGPTYLKVRLSYITRYSVFGPQTVEIKKDQLWLWSRELE